MNQLIIELLNNTTIKQFVAAYDGELEVRADLPARQYIWYTHLNGTALKNSTMAKLIQKAPNTQ